MGGLANIRSQVGGRSGERASVADINGVTGRAILRTIAGGERDANKLAKLRDSRCHKSEEDIADELRGHWREDHLFSLKQALRMYDAIQERIAEYDREILRQQAAMERRDKTEQPAPALKNVQKAKAIEKRGEEPLRTAMYRLAGRYEH